MLAKLDRPPQNEAPVRDVLKALCHPLKRGDRFRLHRVKGSQNAGIRASGYLWPELEVLVAGPETGANVQDRYFVLGAGDVFPALGPRVSVSLVASVRRPLLGDLFVFLEVDPPPPPSLASVVRQSQPARARAAISAAKNPAELRVVLAQDPRPKVRAAAQKRLQELEKQAKGQAPLDPPASEAKP